MFYVIARVTRVVEVIEIAFKLRENRSRSEVVKLIVFLATRVEFLQQTVSASTLEISAHVGSERWVPTGQLRARRGSGEACHIELPRLAFAVVHPGFQPFD